jgi:hypothetical protein
VGVGVLVLVVRGECGYRCVGAGDGGSQQVLVMVVHGRCGCVLLVMVVHGRFW